MAQIFTRILKMKSLDTPRHTFIMKWGILCMIACSLFIPSFVSGQQTITIGTGTSSQFELPINRYYNYAASEIIYLGSEIGTTGLITSIGFQKASGSSSVTITGVTIYLKMTSSTTVGTTASTTGYTQVYSGSFPNDVTSGWVQVDIIPFNFNSTSQNLAILVVKTYQEYVTDYPFYNYSATSDYKSSYYQSDYFAWSSGSSTMTRTNNRPNVQFSLMSGGAFITTTGSGSYTIPSGVSCVKVEAWGGGGRGGNRTSSGAAAGGGGGAYSRGYVTVTPGSYNIFVGAGSTTTSAGGDTWFGSNTTVMAKGGNSVADNGTTGASGGAASSGYGNDVTYNGGNGGNSGTNSGGGGGGAGSTGAGGNASGTTAGTGTANFGGNGGAGRTTSGNGNAGSVYGGGGGGERRSNNPNYNPGNGANGLLIITWAINVSNFSTSASTPVCAGNTSTVTVTSTSLASNTYTVIYNLSGANTATGNTATLVFSGGTGNFTTSAFANSGATTVTITGLDLAGWGCTSTVSSGNTAGITVNANLSAVNVTPNSAQSICIGGSGSQLTAAETGGGSITGRQWGKRSTSGGSITNISGATGSTYTPSGSDLGTGTWYVVCTSTPTCGSATTSNEVTVVVNANLSAVNIAPTGSQIFCLGTSGTQLSAAETGGGSITGRQWGKRTTSGGTITDISGATGSTYTPTGADLGEGTWYVVCRSTPTCGSVGTSNEVTVTVNPHSWTGDINNDWKEASNWCGGVPTASTNVVIPSDATVHVTNDAGSPAECNNLTIESGGVLTIDAGKALTVYGSITKSSNDNDLIIKSDASGTGSLLHSTTSVHATFERYIDNSGTSYNWDWHLLASPVASQAIWPQFAPTPTYVGPNSWNLSWGANPQWDFYYYNPNCPLTGLYWVNLRWTDNTYNYRDPDITNSDAGFGQTVPPVMTPSRGYLAAYYSETGSTHQFAGTLNTGSQSYSATNQNDYYNLVGNPYPSYIDWQSSSLTRTNLENLGTSGSPSYAFWIWNEDYGNYGAFTSAGGTVTPPGINGTSRYIAPSQGFFVKANSKFTTSTQIIGFSQSARTHATQGWLKDTEAATNYIKLVLTTAENTYSDELVVFFDENNNGDNGVEKLASWNSDAPELFSVKEGTDYCIDMLKGVTHNTVINVSAKCGVSGNYTIAAPGINEFALCDEVYLEDLLTGNKIDLRQINSYSFAGGPNDDRARFKLTFAEFAGTNETETIKPLYIYSVGKDVYINANQLTIGRSDVFIYDAVGRLVYRGIYMPAAGNAKYTSLTTPGAYVVKAIARTGTVTAKIIIP